MSSPVRIPADVEREDRVLGPFTARQSVLVAGGGLLLYAGWWCLRVWFSPIAYLALVTPVAGVLVGLALGQREGIGMDRFLLAALSYARAPKRTVHAPEGVPPLPDIVPPGLARQGGGQPVPVDLSCRGVDEAGLLDLGRDGHAAVAWCSTVNFGLRSPAEQEGLAAGFARWLNSLTGPTQILVRSHPVDVEPVAERVRGQAAGLPHPGLAAAARSHADALSDLGRRCDLLGRQVLVVAREPSSGGGSTSGTSRAVQRIAEATGVLVAADVDARPLNAEAVVDAVNAAVAPELPTPPVEEDC